MIKKYNTALTKLLKCLVCFHLAKGEGKNLWWARLKNLGQGTMKLNNYK